MPAREPPEKDRMTKILRLTGQRLRDRPLLRDTGWLLAGQGLSLLLQAVHFVLLAHLLGAVQYGIYVGAFAFTSIAAQYSSLGTGMVLLRYVSSDAKAFPILWGNVLLATCAAGSLLTLFLTWIAPHLLNPSSAGLVAAAAASNCICAQLIAESARACRAFGQMRMTAALNLLTSFLRALAAAVLLLTLQKADAWEWALASLLVSAVGAIAVTVGVTARFGPPQLNLKNLARHSAEGAGYSFAQSTTSLYNDLDKMMLSSFGMNQANGIYSVAYRIVDLATMPIFSLHDAALPRLFQLGQNGIQRSRQMASRLLRKVVPLAGLIAAGLYLAAPLLPRIAGTGFAESASALRWLCLIPVFRSVHTISGAALTGVGLQKYRTATQLFSACLNCALNACAIPRYGWLGAAWASLITDGSLALLNLLLLLKLRWKAYLDAPAAQNSAIPV